MMKLVTTLVSFVRWGLDIVGFFPALKGSKFLFITVDYFTKWTAVEVTKWTVYEL